MSQPRLGVFQLTRRFGGQRAIDDVSFDVAAGEIAGLVGRSGAGKTTTLLCLAGLLRPTSGRVALDGRELGPDRGRHLALIPAVPELYPLLTVWEHLILVSRRCRLADAWRPRAQQLLLQLGLQKHCAARGASLSKALRQKTLIAANLLANAPVLLLDEPMIGLDPLEQRELAEILLGLRAAGTAVLITTKLPEIANVLCDRHIAIADGRIASTRVVDRDRHAPADGDPPAHEPVLPAITA